MTRPSRAETERARAYHELATTMRGLEEDLRWGLQGSLRIPEGWRRIAEAPAVPRKVKLTLRVDADVAAFFRTMGMGHLSRMNAVLRTFMLARLAGVVTGPEAVRYAPSHAEEVRDLRRELLDTVAAELDAREARDPRTDAGARQERIAALKRLRDRRKAEARGGAAPVPKGSRGK